MVVSVDFGMSGAQPKPAGAGPDADAAQEAWRRLHRYLEGFGVPAGQDREALVGRFLAAARGRETADEAGALAARALEAAQGSLTAWFARVLDEAVPEGRPPLLLGRAAFRLCDGAVHWPGVLLSEHPPAEFIDALRVAMPAPTPPEEQGAMVEQDFRCWSLRDLAPSRLARAVLGGGRQAIAS
jgi:hypothetical protein